MLYKSGEYQGLHMTLEQFDDLYVLYLRDDAGKNVTRCMGIVRDGFLNGAQIKVMGLGALLTEPQYRRMGLARYSFSEMGKIMEERGCLVSYLHPFSFNYYRTMGYERVADHRLLEFPIRMLDGIPRHTDLTRIYSTDDVSVLDDIYNRFAANRNIMFRREGSFGSKEPPKDECAAYLIPNSPYVYRFVPNRYYISKDERGTPDGYICYRREMNLVHHHLFGKLVVEELCFTSPAALRRLLGFIRMYDGEVDSVEIRNCGMSPEVELLLREYKYTNITVVPDLSARVHDVGAVLSAVTYPTEHGAFTLRIIDSEKSPFSRKNTDGVWQTEYENGKARVTRLSDDAPCNLTLTMPAFTRLLHGFESGGAELAAYSDGVTLHNGCPDFFRAFPKRPCGLFELY